MYMLPNDEQEQKRIMDQDITIVPASFGTVCGADIVHGNVVEKLPCSNYVFIPFLPARVKTLPDHVNECAPWLVKVGKKVVSVPLGTWGGKLGIAAAQNFRSLFINAGDFLTTALNVSDEELKSTVEAACNEWNETQAYVQWIGVWAQVQK
ncbi:hypothetical protein HDU84_005621 [Entophlyctis sp. JEL0112]|nr:hypothetical protein HDU84_005621 [Entophlyctis sp. JEL0112]